MFVSSGHLKFQLNCTKNEVALNKKCNISTRIAPEGLRLKEPLEKQYFCEFTQTC